MKCSKELISQYYDGELAHDRSLEIESHLQECETCASHLEDYRRISREIKAMPRYFAPTDLRRAVMAEARASTQPRRRWVLVSSLVDFTALIAASISLFFLLSGVFQYMDTQKGVTVTGSFPQNKASNVAPDASLQVKFSKPLDGDAVSRAVKIEPSVQAAVKVDGENLIIEPVEPLQSGTSYTLTLDTTVKDAQGSSLTEPVVLTFSTEPGTPTAIAANPSVTAVSHLPVSTPPAVSTSIPVTNPTVVATQVITGEVVAISSAPRVVDIKAVDGQIWSVGFLPNTQLFFTDGRQATLSDIAAGNIVEVFGTIGRNSTTITALTLRIKGTKIAPTPISPNPPTGAPRIAYIASSHSSGYTDDWISHLKGKGFEVAAFSITEIDSADLSGFQLLVIGITGNQESDTAVRKIRGSGLPVLNGSPHLAPKIGQGAVYDLGNPGRTIYGKTVTIETLHSLTSSYSGDVVVAGETLYRNPIRSAAGTVLASVKDEQGNMGTVWSASGKSVYFGFWYSKDGLNHNQNYWLFFERSVAYLLDLPIPPAPAQTATPTPGRSTPTPTPASPTLTVTPITIAPVLPTAMASTPVRQ